MGRWSPDVFLESAASFFEIEEFGNSSSGRGAWAEALEAARPLRQTAIGFYNQRSPSVFLLKAKPDPVVSFLDKCAIPPVLHDLDVVVLDQILLKQLLALPDTYLADSSNIHFKHNLEEAFNDVRSGRYDAGFFINPTRIDQVQEVATAGLIMPHKSTYFYPKVGSGMVINPLVPDERIVA
jgi:uncharacterized protein (DUF1015 family)